MAHPYLEYEKVLEKYSMTTLKDRREQMCKNLFESMKNDPLFIAPVRDCVTARQHRKYEPPKLRTYHLKKSPVNYCLFTFQ